YHNNHNQVLRVVTKADGTLESAVFGSVADAVFDSAEAPSQELRKAFKNQSLQLVTFSITEKGYALTDGEGDLTASVAEDV
ncbi:mannitol dehydrogenase family protein, partial [Pediococcus acidilactici]